jgi:hypothetical protein
MTFQYPYIFPGEKQKGRKYYDHSKKTEFTGHIFEPGAAGKNTRYGVSYERLSASWYGNGL